MLEDRLLLWKFKRGNREAFRLIYEKYADSLLSLAANLLNDKADAEDVVQDVFISFVQSVEKFHHHLDCSDHPDYVALVDIYRKLKNILDFLENTPRLTKQDLDVYGLKTMGHTSKEIADLLGIELFAVNYSFKKVKNALHMRYPDGGGLKS